MNVKTSTGEYYNNFYKELSVLDEAGNSFDKIKNIIPLFKGDEKVLDIGCGHGGISYELINRGHSVSAVEINDDAIKVLEERGFIVYKRDITQPLNVDDRFNAILILDVLEHIFDPVTLLMEAKKILASEGCIITSVPLYFDIIDRIKILFSGRIISADNLCYGISNYKKFKSYNYDHIRFFNSKEVLEMGAIVGLSPDKIEYIATTYFGKNKILKGLVLLFANKYTARYIPSLFAHSMKVRWKMK